MGGPGGRRPSQVTAAAEAGQRKRSWAAVRTRQHSRDALAEDLCMEVPRDPRV